MSELLSEVAALLDAAVAAHEGSSEGGRLQATRARLDEPLRVAIAGKVKAGKSTLLNALIGEVLAPTDAGECTRIVTWYRESHVSQVTVVPRHGAPRRSPFHRDGGAISVDLMGLDDRDVLQLEIDWPSSSLRGTTLIDCPGIDSLSAEVSSRAFDFLAPEDDRDTPADAVLYLMRHLHESDVRFLEAFHDDEMAQATPINAIAVLSRADEIGVGRIDAMDSAGRIATRYRGEPAVRRLAQTVVPVAGLLAEAAATLREDEFRALREVAAASDEVLGPLLLSADRFGTRETDGMYLPAEARRALLDRFGLYGIRVAIDLLRRGVCTDATTLAEELRAASGIDALRDALRSQFAGRRDVLKARAGLAALDAVLRSSGSPEAPRLATELERLEAGAHEFAEIRLLNALRTGAVDLDDTEAAERLLGTDGTDARTRLGLERDSGTEMVQETAKQQAARWQRVAEHPLTDRGAADAARVLARTCEGIAVQAVV